MTKITIVTTMTTTTICYEDDNDVDGKDDNEKHDEIKDDHIEDIFREKYQTVSIMEQRAKTYPQIHQHALETS